MSVIRVNLPPDIIEWLETKARKLEVRPSYLLSRIVQEHMLLETENMKRQKPAL